MATENDLSTASWHTHWSKRSPIPTHYHDPEWTTSVACLIDNIDTLLVDVQYTTSILVVLPHSLV